MRFVFNLIGRIANMSPIYTVGIYLLNAVIFNYNGLHAFAALWCLAAAYMIAEMQIAANKKKEKK